MFYTIKNLENLFLKWLISNLDKPNSHGNLKEKPSILIGNTEVNLSWVSDDVLISLLLNIDEEKIPGASIEWQKEQLTMKNKIEDELARRKGLVRIFATSEIAKMKTEKKAEVNDYTKKIELAMFYNHNQNFSPEFIIKINRYFKLFGFWWVVSQDLITRVMEFQKSNWLEQDWLIKWKTLNILESIAAAWTTTI